MVFNPTSLVNMAILVLQQHDQRVPEAVGYQFGSGRGDLDLVEVGPVESQQVTDQAVLVFGKSFEQGHRLDRLFIRQKNARCPVFLFGLFLHAEDQHFPEHAAERVPFFPGFHFVLPGSDLFQGREIMQIRHHEVIEALTDAPGKRCRAPVELAERKGAEILLHILVGLLRFLHQTCE